MSEPTYCLPSFFYADLSATKEDLMDHLFEIAAKPAFPRSSWDGAFVAILTPRDKGQWLGGTLAMLRVAERDKEIIDLGHIDPWTAFERDIDSGILESSLGDSISRYLIAADTPHQVTRAAAKAAACDEIRGWSHFDSNWDGEDASKPIPASLEMASRFVELLDDAIEIPEPMLNANGAAGLYWKNGDLYADLEFLGDGRLAYYIEKHGAKHKGVIPFDARSMPPVLATLLRSEGDDRHALRLDAELPQAA